MRIAPGHARRFAIISLESRRGPENELVNFAVAAAIVSPFQLCRAGAFLMGPLAPLFHFTLGTTRGYL